MTHTEMIDREHIICPYCEHRHDGNQSAVIECSECGMYHHLETGGAHHTYADCNMNGMDHNEITKRTRGINYKYCDICDIEL